MPVYNLLQRTNFINKTREETMAFKFKAKYGNYIGGKFVDPVDGKYFDNI